MRYDLCEGDHSNGHCAYQNNLAEEEAHYMGNQGREGGFSKKHSQGWRSNQNQSFKQCPFQRQQPIYPSSQKRIIKLEYTLEKFMQTTLSNEKNFNIVVQSLETQMGQIAQELKKSKEQCKSVTT